MTAIQAPQHRVTRTRRPAYRRYAAGALVHAALGAALAGLGYRSSAALLVVAVFLALLAIVSWRRKAVIETTESSRRTSPTVLHTDTR